MKKIVLILSLVLVASSNSFSQRDVDNQLLNKLSTYNENSTSKTIVEEAGKKWWQTLLDIITVAGADIGGAYAGVVGSSHIIGAVGLATGGLGAAIVGGAAGLLGGAGASNAAWHGVHRPVSGSLGYGNLSISVPAEFNYLSNEGRNNNYVLHNFFINSGNITDFYRTFLDDEQIKVMVSQPMNDLKSSIEESVTNNFATVESTSFGSFCSDLVRKGLMTRMGQSTLNLFFEKYRRCNSPESMQGLINYYIAEIYNSSVSVLEKRSLIASLMVASESPFYWGAPR